jgi:FtsH-binding integral membrane protein
MEIKDSGYEYKNVIQITEQDASRKFIANVFLWMFVALGISAVCAYVFSQNQALYEMLRNPETGRNTGLGTLVMFAPLAFVLIISFGFQRLSYGVAALLFVAFSAIMGVSLSYILVVYTTSSVAWRVCYYIACFWNNGYCRLYNQHRFNQIWFVNDDGPDRYHRSIGI